MNDKRVSRKRLRGMPQAQRGVAMIIFTIGMVAIIGTAGLALDMGHAYLNKTRLQNALDAAALSGAKLIDENQTCSAAVLNAAWDTFSKAGNTYGDLAGKTPEDLGFAVEYFDAYADVPAAYGASPCAPDAEDDPGSRFVRVRADNFSLAAWFIQVLGFSEKTVAASAVSGPSTPLDRICDNLTPMVVCADTDGGGAGVDDNCKDDDHAMQLVPVDPDDPDGPKKSVPDYSAKDGIPDCYGYNLGDDIKLKLGAATKDESLVGPGNFQLICLEGDNCGANEIRDWMAGGFEKCLDIGEDIPPKEGNNAGPVAQGLNTRMGIYSGSMSEADGKPDLVLDHADYGEGGYSPPIGSHPGTHIAGYGHDQYDDAYEPIDYETADKKRWRRREMGVPFAHCDGKKNLTFLGLGCYFLKAPVNQQGVDQLVIGEFFGGCEASGVPGNDPGPGPYEIILYKDPARQDA